MKPVGIFGGSFDPVHWGHLKTAEKVAEIRNLDKIILIPCWVSPLKTDTMPRAGKHRLEMLKLAVKGSSLFEVSDIEINKPSVSYSIDTVKALLPVYHNIELIIGYDNLVVFDKWKDPDELVQLVKLIVLRRKLEKEPKVKNKYFNYAVQVSSPEINISSTVVRKRVHEGRPIGQLVPDIVVDYIKKHKLYRNEQEPFCI